MKRILAAAVALSLIGGSAFAGDHGHGRGHGRDGDRWEDRDHDRWDGHDRGLHRGHYKKWRKGERIGGYRYVVVEPYRTTCVPRRAAIAGSAPTAATSCWPRSRPG
jgi:Ni/Co efflux regulator RcnB